MKKNLYGAACVLFVIALIPVYIGVGIWLYWDGRRERVERDRYYRNSRVANS